MKIPFAKVIITLCIMYIGYVVLNVKNDPFQKVKISNPYQEPFEINDLHIESFENLYETFPYEVYVQKIDFTNFHILDAHLVELDTITKNSFLTQSILSVALTSKLTQLNSTDLDTLHSVLQWSDQFQEYSLQQTNYQGFYQSIQSYWYNQVANTLTEMSKQNSDIKFRFKYRYLIQRCKEKGFIIGGKVSKTEKIVIYFVEQKWSYLFYRFWNGTSLLFKGIVFSAILINLIFMGLGIKHIKLKYIK